MFSIINPAIVQEIVSGTRKRSSFAPMVWMTGCLMAHEANRLILHRKGGAGVRGIFFNYHTYRMEKPKN
jgi:molybdopterin-synthase adenylyltransferase